MPTIDLTPKDRSITAEEELIINFVSGEASLNQNIGGVQFFANGFRAGAGNNVFGFGVNGLHLGAADFADAPLQMFFDGTIKASKVDLGGSGYTKLTIFKQDGIPTSVAVGDLWFDTNDGNKLYRAGMIGADQIAVGEWELVAATAITVFAQNSIPTSTAIGDLWYDTDDSNKPYRAASVGANTIASGQWVLVNDLRAADAIVKSGSSQTLTGDIVVGDAKVKVDGTNKRFTVADASGNIIILLGYQSGGF